MNSGALLIIFGMMSMWGGYFEWEVARSQIFTFKESTLVGGFMLLMGCLICTIETAAHRVVKAIKEGKL